MKLRTIQVLEENWIRIDMTSNHTPGCWSVWFLDDEVTVNLHITDPLYDQVMQKAYEIREVYQNHLK